MTGGWSGRRDGNRTSHPAIPSRVPGGSIRSTTRYESADQCLHDRREFLTRLGQAIEVVLPLAAWGDDAAMPEEGQVMADGGLALVQFLAQGPHVLLARGERQDH